MAGPERTQIFTAYSRMATREPSALTATAAVTVPGTITGFVPGVVGVLFGFCGCVIDGEVTVVGEVPRLTGTVVDDEDEDGPDLLRVRITAADARAFVSRAS